MKEGVQIQCVKRKRESEREKKKREREIKKRERERMGRMCESFSTLLKTNEIYRPT